MNPTNIMFQGRLEFSGTHPPEFQESALQNTSFPFGGSRLRTQVSRFSRDDYSETWTPGNCRSPCRGTQVSRFLRDICSETRRAPNEVGYLNKQTLRFFLLGVRVSEHTLPGPRETSVRRHDPRGILGVRVTEYKFLCPREPLFRDTDPGI